jgi:PilZ domain-containing protein
MAGERRKQRRIPVRIDSYWKNCTKAGIGYVSNLSVGGCRLVSKIPLELGDHTVLTMYLGSGGTLTIQGHVVSAGSKGVGVQFDRMTASLEFQINEALQSLK